MRAFAATMPRLARLTLLIVGILFASVPTILARGADGAIVDADMVFSSPIVGETPADSLLLQATFFAGDGVDYILTLSNLSQWPLAEIRVLDRYFDPESDEELAQAWELDRLEPGQAASVVIAYGPDELDGLSVADACHQIEINWSDGWSSFLMDCTGLGSTSLWYIPLQEEMAVYAELEPAIVLPLTQEEPIGRSKMGLHVTRNNASSIMAFVEQAQPAIIVGVGDLGWLADVKEVSPDTITLGRFEEKGQTFTGDPIQRAQQFVVSHAGRYLANPGVDYWLGWNEPVIRYPWQMEWYAAFEVERTRLMHDLGLRVAVGNFSTGTPEADQFPSFMPALVAAKEYGGLFALHEYSAPTMLHGVGAAIPGHEAESRSGALTLRYRYWYENYLGPANLVVPLVITEAGIDGGVLRNQDPSLGGWRDFDGVLAADLTVQNLNSYLAEVSWYDDELRCDPYVLGFALFNAGDIDGDWESFDITDELPAFAALANSKD